MGELGALFNPGMRHEIEERESKQNRREEEGNARDGDLRIDLASGVAVINIPGRPTPDESASVDRADTSRGARAGSNADSGHDPSAPGQRKARTAADKPSTPVARSRSERVADRAAQNRNVDRRKDQPSPGTAAGAAGSTATPSSKASRAAR